MKTLTNIAQKLTALMWICPCESDALEYLGIAKEKLINEGLWYEENEDETN